MRWLILLFKYSLSPEVQLCMSHVGMCGSDVQYWQPGAITDFIFEAPVILGHKAAGLSPSVWFAYSCITWARAPKKMYRMTCVSTKDSD